jgi:hypothetical protein
MSNPAGLPSCISSNGGSGRAVPTVSAGGGIINVLGTMLAIQQALNHSPAASGVTDACCSYYRLYARHRPSNCGAVSKLPHP